MKQHSGGQADYQAHESAVIESDVHIGSGTRIWHHAHIRSGARIGEDCVIGKNVYIESEAHVGRGVHIQNNAGVLSGVVLEDEVFIGPSVVFTNDRLPRAGSEDWMREQTRVRKGASIGGNATIVGGIEIGRWAMIGAGAVVTKHVTDHELVAGNPARRLGWVCRCGTVVARTSGNLERPLKCERCGAAVPEERAGRQP